MSSLAAFVNPTIGAGPAPGQVHPEQRFRLGTTAIGNDGNTYVYISAPLAVAAAASPVVNALFTVTAATGGTRYTAPQAFAANEFGWVRMTTSPL